MRFLEQIIFRTPLLPFSFTGKYSLDTDNYLNKIFLEASYLASPTLHKEIIKYKNDLIRNSKEKIKIRKTFYKYSARASTRCTPFGLFAGLSTCQWGDSSEIILNNDVLITIDRKTKLDMNVSCSIAYLLAKNSIVKPHLKYYPNNSIYKIGDFYRYVEYYHNPKRIHVLNKVDYSEYLKVIFDKSERGLYVEELKQLLIDREISKEEATEVIDELIGVQLLVSELEPSVTGTDFFEILINKLQAIYIKSQNKELKELLFSLSEIKQLISILDVNKTNEIKSYKVIFEKIKKILPHVSETNIFQVDLFKHTEKATLNKETQQSIMNAVEFLNKITPEYKNQNIERFKKRFRDRFEDSEIPLLKVLDSETGLGYPNKDKDGINTLVDDLNFFDGSKNPEISWDKLQTRLFQILTEHLKEPKYCLELTDADFTGINFSSNSLPHSLSVRFKVIDADNNRICFDSIGGSSAVNLLGRFANGNDSVLSAIKAIADHEEEQANGRIMAEIVHLPETRSGNVISRPTIRKHEIPYLAKSMVNKECQLDLNDIFVSIRNNFIILRSKKLNKEIIPRLGNAHNYSFKSLPVYHFLCDLQTQYYKKSFLSFNWGGLSNQFNFLPRIEYKNVILSAAKWQFKKPDFEFLLKQKDEAEILEAFSLFKNKHKLPDLFLFIEGDNELLIDTKQNMSICVFVDILKNKRNICITEFLFDSEKALIKDDQKNAFTNECIAIILNDKHKLADVRMNAIDEVKSERSFILGSEWLYFKIYSGVKTIDYILKEKISIITEYLLKENIIDKWFFIRYSDPETHLRFRLHVKNASKFNKIIEIVYSELNDLVQEGIIYNVQTEKYTREIERYGDNLIDITEKLFYYDSICCLNSLKLLDSEEDERTRWQYALRATDQLLIDFKLDLNGKYNLVNNLSRIFFAEHGGKKALKLQLDVKFRNYKKIIPDVLSSVLPNTHQLFALSTLLNERSKQNKGLIEEGLKIKQTNKVALNDLLGDYLHMMNNRIFMAKQRTNEFVVYDLLSRHYKAELAILKHKNKKETADF